MGVSEISRVLNGKAKGIIREVADILPGIDCEGLPRLADIKRDPDLDYFYSRGFTFKPELDLESMTGSLRHFLRIRNGMNLFFKKFEDQVVVDLGAGRYPFSYLAIQDSGARAYIGVEPNTPAWLLGGISNYGLIEGYKARRKIPAAIASEDMLKFVKRLPDNSVSFFASSIDEIILPDEKYRARISDEVKRALNPQGACITFGMKPAINPVGIKETPYLDILKTFTK